MKGSLQSLKQSFPKKDCVHFVENIKWLNRNHLGLIVTAFYNKHYEISDCDDLPSVRVRVRVVRGM